MKLSTIIFSSAIILLSLVPTGGFATQREQPKEKHVESEVVGEITTKMHGKIEKLPKNGLLGTWVVKGRDVIVTKDTHIDERQGKVATGVFIEVEGNTKGNAIEAFEIEVEGDILHSGKIESLPKDGIFGVWVVSGKKVKVSKETHIDKEDLDKIAIGVTIDIEGEVIGDVIDAFEIEAPTPAK